MIFQKINGDWFMHRRLMFVVYALVISWDICLLFAAMLGMTYDITHNGRSVTVMWQMMGVWGLLPAFVLTIFTLFGLVAPGIKPLPKEWKPDDAPVG